MTIKRLVRLVTVTLREDQQEFNIQRSPIEKKRRGEGKRKRKKRKKKKKKDEAIDAFFFLQRKASSRQGWKWNKASDVRINTRLNYKSSGANSLSLLELLKIIWNFFHVSSDIRLKKIVGCRVLILSARRLSHANEEQSVALRRFQGGNKISPDKVKWFWTMHRAYKRFPFFFFLFSLIPFFQTIRQRSSNYVYIL